MEIDGKEKGKPDGKILAFLYRMGYICMAWRVEIFLISPKMKQGAFFCSDVFLFPGIEKGLKIRLWIQGGEILNEIYWIHKNSLQSSNSV